MENVWKGKRWITEDDHLEKLCDLLENTYHAEVNVFAEKKVFKGLYFCTKEMKEAMSDWSEIVFVDCTKKLFKKNLSLMSTVVEDNNGNTQVAGMGILVDEDESTMKWFFECFEESHKAACENISAFMMNVEFPGKNVIKNIFEGKSTFICTFDTLRIFSRDVTPKKMGITAQEKAQCKELFSKLVKSQTEQEYETNYEEFSKIAPQSVQEYYNINWEPNRTEWTHYSMFHNNLGNTTNNRLKSLKTQIKIFMKPDDDLVPAVKNLFKAFESRDREMEFAKAQRILKREIVVRYAEDSVEMKYKNAVTRYAFEYIIKELECFETIALKDEDIDGEECVIHTSDEVLTVTSTTCQCKIAMGLLMPCRHIFAVRKQLHLPLFDEKLCGRWIKRGLEKTQAYAFSNSGPSKKTSQSIPSKELSVIQKQQLLKPIMDDIMELMMHCSDSEFEKRLAVLKDIADKWSRGIEISIQVVTPSGQLRGNLMKEPSQSSLKETHNSQTNESVRIVEDQEIGIADVNVKPQMKLKDHRMVPTPVAKKRKIN